MEMKTKYCHKCCKSKLMREFNNHSDTKDGKQTTCRECEKKRYLKNKEVNMYEMERI